MNKITLNPERSKGVINKNIYGHFSEHLGRCIYQVCLWARTAPFPM